MKMNNKNFDKEIDKFIESNWEQIVQDIDALVRIPSYADKSEYSKTYPTGKEPAIAMKKALDIAKRMGFKTKNHKNIIGIADVPGKSKKMIGFIGHCDVVPEGFGWKNEPFKVTRREGYLLGRGVADDKGPVILMLNAIKFLMDKYDVSKEQMPYTLRFLFGTDEEQGMTDVEAYKAAYPEPEIVISPDAEFPICFGETGLTRCRTTSPKIKGGQIKYLWGGSTENAVPGVARAIIQMPKGKALLKHGTRLSHAILVEPFDGGQYQVTATGRSAHASTPFEGLDAIAILINFLLEKGIGNKQERAFMNFIAKVAGRPTGDGIGLNISDENFGGLTIVTTMLRLEDGKMTQSFDVRYPTGITAKGIAGKIRRAAPKGSSTITFVNDSPMIIRPNSPVIEALSSAFKQGTGQDAKLFTMGGSTYSRHFKHGTSFGPEMYWIPRPAWVGNLHGPDEGMSEEIMKSALKIYIYAVKNLLDLDLNSSNLI